MSQQLIVVVFEVVLLVLLITLFSVAIVASIHDIRLTRRLKGLAKTRSRLRGGARPSITVLVCTKNNETSIADCLSSIRRDCYGLYDIVVIDRRSTDGTRQVVREFIRNNPKVPLKLYSRRKRAGQIKLLSLSYGRSQKSDLILTINGSDILPRRFLKDCAARFKHDDITEARKFVRRAFDPDSITSLYYRFQQLNDVWREKFLSTMGLRLSGRRDIVMYRRSTFLQMLQRKPIKVNLDSGLVVNDNCVKCDKEVISHLLPRFKKASGRTIISGISLLLIQTYSIQVAAIRQDAILLILGCVVASTWLLLLAWSSEDVSTKNRLELTFCAPFIYFLIYVHLLAYELRLFSALLLTPKKQRSPVTNPQIVLGSN